MSANVEHVFPTFRGAVDMRHVATFRWPAGRHSHRHFGGWPFRPWYPNPDPLAFSENRLLGRAQEDRHSLRTWENHVVGCYELHEATFHPSDSERLALICGFTINLQHMPTFR